jgi:hypothetical protein
MFFLQGKSKYHDDPNRKEKNENNQIIIKDMFSGDQYENKSIKGKVTTLIKNGQMIFFNLVNRNK